jgi:hypothetical protein
MGVFSLSPLSLFHKKKRKGVEPPEGRIEPDAGRSAERAPRTAKANAPPKRGVAVA